MPGSTFSCSSLLFLLLAASPLSVLAAPALDASTNLNQRHWNPSTETESGETDTGSTWDFGIPGGPSADMDHYYHDEYFESGPARRNHQRDFPFNNGGGDQSHSSETDAGSNWEFSIPGGPSANLGNYYHHEHAGSVEGEDASPPPPQTVTVTPTPTPTPVPTPPPTVVAPPATTALPPPPVEEPEETVYKTVVVDCGC